jgi:hypothetical protein
MIDHASVLGMIEKRLRPALIATSLRVTKAELYLWARANSVSFYPVPTVQSKKSKFFVSQSAINRLRRGSRNDELASLYSQGLSMSEIGLRHNISRARVQQLFKSAGITSKDGGPRVVFPTLEKEKKTERYGFPIDEWRQLVRDGLTGAFHRQRNSARGRGIEWGMTFLEWMTIWRDSGHLGNRGRGKGKYVMSRNKDSGSYVVGNVSIKPSTENNREAMLRDGQRGKKLFHTGVYLIYPGNASPWLARVGRKTIGAFPSMEAGMAARETYIKENGCKVLGNERGYTVVRKRKTVFYQVQVGRKYVGIYKSHEAAVAARKTFIESRPDRHAAKPGSALAQGKASQDAG